MASVILTVKIFKIASGALKMENLNCERASKTEKPPKFLEAWLLTHRIRQQLLTTHSLQKHLRGCCCCCYCCCC
ncbi:hypothetical protein CapIbe_008150 [Capra ibex]